MVPGRAQTIALATILAGSAVAQGRVAVAAPAPPQQEIRLPPIQGLSDGPPCRCECTQAAPSPSWWTTRRKVGLAVLGVGLLSATAGYGFAVSARNIQASAIPTTPLQEQLSEDAQIRWRRDAAGALLLGGAAGLLSGALLTLWSIGPTVTVTRNGEALIGYRGTI
jgi:hypothetical protein